MLAEESLITPIHIELVGLIFVPFFLFWLDTRRLGKKMHDETQKQNWQMHSENQQRLAEIETKLEPVWAWWSRLRNEGK